MNTQKLLKKGYPAYLAYVSELEKGEVKLKDIPIVKDFPDVFPKELPGLPLEREVEVPVDMIPGTAPIAQSHYRIAPTKLIELKIQL